MRYLLRINGHEHRLDLTPGRILSCRLDGLPFEAEAAEAGPGVYSLLIGGKSFHVRIAPAVERTGGMTAPDSNLYSAEIDGASYTVSVGDPRRWNRSRSAMAPEGRQQITAPMPGKVVHLLVVEGQQVEAGHGLIVIEAMKMQNEIRCRAAGTIGRLLVREGQAVTAGESLLIIE
jgi:biotin carboxyl carrier protein